MGIYSISSNGCHTLVSDFEEGNSHRNVSSFATFVSLLLRLGKDRVTMPQTPGVCVTCGGGEDEGTLRTCDGCDRDFHCHAHCHWPPIEGPKQGDWLCEACEPSHPSRCSAPRRRARSTGANVTAEL